MATCLRETMAFRRAANNQVSMVQANLLLSLLKRASKTDYGCKYGFASIRSVNDYRERVPVNDYDDLQPWIERIANCGDQVLTADRVLLFEETSGTGGGTRLIPYTAGLQASFNRALHPWLFDLHSHYSGIWGGPAYWAVSPRSNGSRKTPGGITIGFANDSDYFGRWAKPLIKALTIVPEEVAGLSDPMAWRYVTVLSLLRSPDMRLVSLWNPGLFTALLGSIEEWADVLSADLIAGTCKPGFLKTESLAGFENFTGKPSARRAEVFKEALRMRKSGNNAEFARLLWPRIALVSSWSEAEASGSAAYLKSFFPDAFYQTKGLLATEGPVTVPMT
ncbi:MAG: GH3 auxin-responsive promoter family protein, partial [Candidatus Riflebacteria bacterium]|nr:GH3 auxin-responsive promoter family protein [Candidatus Riflebacteria bacterium]